MGESLVRRALLIAAVFLAAVSFAGCASILEDVRDTIARGASAPEDAVKQTERRDIEQYLTRRFRSHVASSLPGERIGTVKCADVPDLNDPREFSCTLAVGSTGVPVYAQYNITDRHLNAALGRTVVRSDWLTNDTATWIRIEYGAAAKITCPGKAFLSAPGVVRTCGVSGAPAIGKSVSVHFLDTNGWRVLIAPPVPKDEAGLQAAFDRSHGRSLPGALVSRILLRRMFARLAQTDPNLYFGGVICPKAVPLRPNTGSACKARIDGEDVAMQIAFVAGRLAYRTDGAWVDVPRLVAAEVRFLRKTRRTPSNAHVSIDCYRQNAVFVEPGGFHWCEVTGPKRYPKRLVIVGMDAEGHYDAFFSNFSQAAYGN